MRAGRKHVDRQAGCIIRGKRRGKHPAFQKGFGARQAAQIVEIGLNAINARCIERRSEICSSLLASCTLHNHFGKHGIIEGRYVGPRRDPAIDADTVGKADLGEQSRGRLEILSRIFGVEPDLNRVSLRLAPIPVQAAKLTGRLPHHNFDEVEARHLLGHGMLDLEPRIHFEEIELLFLLVIDELDRAGGCVGNCFAKTHGRFMQSHALRSAEAGSGRLLDHLLVAALGRAIALAERNHAAFTVAENLDLDMTRGSDVFFEEETAILEIRKCKPPHRLIEAGHVIGGMAELQADTAASRRAFQHDGIADLGCPCQRIVEIDDQRRSRQKRHPALLRELPGRMLQREGAHMFRPRPDKCDTFTRQRGGEFRILAEEPVSRMNGLRTRLPDGRKNGVDIEITFRDRRGPHVNGFIRQADMGRKPIRVGIDRNRRYSHAPQRLDDANCYLATIGDQNFLEHRASDDTRQHHPGGNASGVPDQCTNGRGVESIAGIVHLWTIRDNAEQIHLCAYLHVIARFRYPVDNSQRPIFLDWHIHEEVDVGNDVALGEAVTRELHHEIVTAAMHVACLIAEAHRIRLRRACACRSIVITGRIGDHDTQHIAEIRNELRAHRHVR